MSRLHPAVQRGTGTLVFMLLGLLACAEPGPTAPKVPLVLDARGDGSPPKVNEAVPNEAPQDTTLIVRVIGSGFDDGSVARFLLAGQSTPKMIVHATHFVADTTLDVELTVAADADVALYDIEVMTLRGKKGIGSEMFSVKLKGAPLPDIPVSATFRDAAGDGVRSDSPPGAPEPYDAVILEIGNLFLDARVDIPRQLCLAFAGQPGAPDDVCDDGYFSTAQPDVPGGLRAMAVGSAMKTIGQVTWVKDGFNWFLRFGLEDCDTGQVVDHQVDVTHPDADTWILDGSTACLLQMRVKGRPAVVAVGFFDAPFQLTVVRQ